MAEHSASTVMAEIAAAAPLLPRGAVITLADHLRAASRIYIHGVGRCGLVMRSFAIRLAHLGLAVAVVGEPSTTAAAAGDLVVVGSGSGGTETALAIVRAAHAAGATVVGLTAAREGGLAGLADAAIIIPGTAKDGTGALASVQPPGSLFEQMLFLFLEETVLHLARQFDPDFAMIRRRHANLE